MWCGWMDGTKCGMDGWMGLNVVWVDGWAEVKVDSVWRKKHWSCRAGHELATTRFLGRHSINRTA